MTRRAGRARSSGGRRQVFLQLALRQLLQSHRSRCRGATNPTAGHAANPTDRARATMPRSKALRSEIPYARSRRPCSVATETGNIECLQACLLYTSDAADERSSVDLG